MRIFAIVMLACALTACGASQAQIQTAIAQTQVAQPTATTIPTPTPVPLADLDLSTTLIASGDLPAGVEGAQIRDTAEDKFRNLPKAENEIFQQFSNSGRGMGGVTVWLYESSDDVAAGFKNLSKRIGGSARPIESLGETSAGVMPGIGSAMLLGVSINLLAGEVTFTRCHALVYIAMAPGSAGLEAIGAYAKNLDERLRPLVCR